MSSTSGSIETASSKHTRGGYSQPCSCEQPATTNKRGIRSASDVIVAISIIFQGGGTATSKSASAPMPNA